MVKPGFHVDPGSLPPGGRGGRQLLGAGDAAGVFAVFGLAAADALLLVDADGEGGEQGDEG